MSEKAAATTSPGYDSQTLRESRLGIGKPFGGRLRRYITGVPVWAAITILSVLIALPVIALVLASFVSQPPSITSVSFRGLGLQHYQRLMSNPRFGEMVGTTLGTAGLSALLALVVGTSAAWLVVRTDLRGRWIANLLMLLPLYMSPLIGAVAWVTLASPRAGLLNVILRGLHIPLSLNIYSFGGIIFVLVTLYSPYIYLFATAALQNMDSTYEEASIICGASRFRTTFHITIRLIWAAVTSSVLLVIVLLIQLFAIPEVIGSPANYSFIAVTVWEQIMHTPPEPGVGAALGVLMLIFTAILVFTQGKLTRGRSYTTLSGRTASPSRMHLRRSVAVVASVLLFCYIFIAVILPYLGLFVIAANRKTFLSSASQIFDLRLYTLEKFRTMFSNSDTSAAVVNTGEAVFWALLIGLVFYFTISYIIERTQLRGRRLLSILAMSPVSIPPIVLGIGILWVWIAAPGDIYGSIWILVIAFIALFVPYGVRAISASLVQIDVTLEEASTIAGSGFFRTLRRIVLPLSRPGIAAAAVLLTVLSVRELVIPLFLYSAHSRVLAIVMFDGWNRGSLPDVAALALFQSLALLVVVGAIQLIGGRKGSGSAFSM